MSPASSALATDRLPVRTSRPRKTAREGVPLSCYVRRRLRWVGLRFPIVLSIERRQPALISTQGLGGWALRCEDGGATHFSHVGYCRPNSNTSGWLVHRIRASNVRSFESSLSAVQLLVQPRVFFECSKCLARQTASTPVAMLGSCRPGLAAGNQNCHEMIELKRPKRSPQADARLLGRFSDQP